MKLLDIETNELLNEWNNYNTPYIGKHTKNIVYPKTKKSLTFDAKTTESGDTKKPSRIINTNPLNMKTLCNIIKKYPNNNEEEEVETIED
jgi:hypothetical protein